MKHLTLTTKIRKSTKKSASKVAVPLRFFVIFVSFVVLFIWQAALIAAEPTGNLLRNGDFQDDWLTLLPELKNHHWCYVSEWYNRRDYNPDGWSCKGNWEWQNADAPPGQRRLILKAPSAEVVQRVNGWTVHDDRSKFGFPDAGGFPNLQVLRSKEPLRLVRDLTFRVRLSARELPDQAGSVEIAWCSAGGADSDPFGSTATTIVQATASLPKGTYEPKWVEVKLLAADWKKAAEAAAAKDPKEAAEVAKSGLALPGAIRATIRVKGDAGQVELDKAELLEAAPSSPNLLANGNFAETPPNHSYPLHWEKPVKYHYFPPGHYYIFNTWHNSRFENRGPVELDELICHDGVPSLRMVVPAGDEKAVASEPVVLKQKDPRLIEVRTFVKTDHLCMLQIDAVDEKGERLDAFNFINKAPMSIGTNDWRLIRQVFRPRKPVESLRLMLCARGVNGYTLDGTGTQPQNNACGTIWWADVQLFEPESTADDLAARGIKPPKDFSSRSEVYLEEVRMGEGSLGSNVLEGTLVNATTKEKTCRLEWTFTPHDGKAQFITTKPVKIAAGGREHVELQYEVGIDPASRQAYHEQRGRLSLLGLGRVVSPATEFWIGHWTSPIDMRLGALYLRPDQKQLVRLNLGLSSKKMVDVNSVQIDVLRRSTGELLKKWSVAATPDAIVQQRRKIPQDLRGDFTNLLLTDLDVGFLPLQPFNDPQRDWLVRARVLSKDGKTVLAEATSQPFCRLDHEPKQPAIESVSIQGNLLYVNKQPWMPFGVCYGHCAVYDGPADPGKYRDLNNLPAWSMYDRFSAEGYKRSLNDFNCMRYVAGSITPFKTIDERWSADNLYCSTAFAVPQPVYSVDELATKAGGKDKLDAYLALCKSSPAVVSTVPGIEEAFGLFHQATPEQLKGLEAIVEYLRKGTGKPVMVGHGGYWNRFEFEKVPFFDIYDPETEPFFPANIHTDFAPLVKGKDRVLWLRPQMYEDVPYERWRFHVLVELMRGCRGWQIAHGPGDASLFRGLHAELKCLEPYVYSKERGPELTVEPGIEHWSRQREGKLVIIAATTHGITLGRWRWDEAQHPEGFARSRRTDQADELRTEANAYSVDRPADTGPSVQGIHSLPDARSWPAGTKLVQWVRIDPDSKPKNLVLLAKADGRWTHAAAWGKFEAGALRKDPKLAYWFLQTFYRHANGFLGWGTDLVDRSLGYIPESAKAMGELPEAAKWLKLEVELEKLGAVDKLLDGVAGMNDGGRVWWGPALLVAPDGKEHELFGDSVQQPSERLAKTKFSVPGLKSGTKVRVLFEDRELKADEGSFTDDLRGQDLYQRFGGGLGIGYGDEPVAVRVYELTLK
jgi:hypothetical protein